MISSFWEEVEALKTQKQETSFKPQALCKVIHLGSLSHLPACYTLRHHPGVRLKTYPCVPHSKLLLHPKDGEKNLSNPMEANSFAHELTPSKRTWP